MSIRTIIVDDEFYARETVRLLLSKVSEVEIVAECSNGPEAVTVIQQHRPDLVFLDIQMPGMDGFEVVKQLKLDPWPCFIFATAYDQYALRAFEVNALDYLLKPYADDRFYEALERAKDRIRQQEMENLSLRLMNLVRKDAPDAEPTPNFPARIPVKGGGKVTFVPVDDITWIEAADQYIHLHTGTKTHLMRESMSGIEAQLDPDRFCRIHRSAIIRLDQVKEVHAHFKGDFIVVLDDGTQVKGSRSRKETLDQKLSL